MAVQFQHSNRAIDRFMASQQVDNAERRAEQQDFERRRQTEQTAGVDRAIREGIGGFYAGNPPASAAPIVAQPASQQPVAAPVAPSQAPATAPMPQLFPPNPAETGSREAQPVVTPGGMTAAPVQADIVKPPANVTPNAPAINAAVAGPQPAIAGFSANPQTSTMMNRLAQTPGSSAAMAQLHGQEQQRQERGAQRDQQSARLRQAAEIQAIKAMHDGDPSVAEAIARHYNINIPPEVIKSAQFQQSMKRLGDLIKGNGITDDVMAASITREYLNAKSAGSDEQTAVTAAFSKAAKPAGKGPKRTYDSVRGAWVEEPTDENPTGRALQPPALPARAVSSGRGGKGGGQGSVFQQKQRAWLELHPGDQQGALDFASGKRGATPSDLQRAANNMVNASKDRMGRPTIKYEQAYEKAKQMLSGTAAAPGPATPPGNRPPLSSFER